jgi:hypothetical protein
MKYAILKDKEIVRFEESDCFTKLNLNAGEYPYACHKAHFEIGDKIYMPQDDLRDFVTKKYGYGLMWKVGYLYAIGSLFLAASLVGYYFLIH